MNAQLKMDNGLSPLRVGRITGSRVGAILGLNPYSKPADVLREMVREACGAPREFTGNEATDYGKAKEPEALALYEAQRGVMTYGGDDCIVHPRHDFLAVTPDGLVESDGMVECKAPYRGNYTHWSDKPYYTAQMRLQTEVCEREWCDFAVLDRAGNLHISRMTHYSAWLPSVMGRLEDFMAEYAKAMNDPAAYLADREREDAAWREAAEGFRTACLHLEAAEAAQKAARDALLALAGDASAKGCGVQVVRSERAGSVDYARAIKELAPGADLSPYTGNPTVIYTVKELKA
jgi:putative phage-type endonuclease